MANQTPLGSRSAWMRDFVLVGACAALAPAKVIGEQMAPFVAGAALAGPLTGALLGLVLRPVLLGPLSRVPFGALVVVGLVLGAVWGGLVGLGAGGFAGAVDPDHMLLTPSTMMSLGALYGAGAGAIQLGWFFVPYTVQRARGRRAWPVVVAACLISPALGVLSLFIL
jgi:hypothetical protein